MANQKNFGLAAETSSRFFGLAREMANQAQDANSRRALENLLALRDKVTASLAKGDAVVIGDPQELFVKTRQATEKSSRPPAVAESLQYPQKSYRSLPRDVTASTRSCYSRCTRAVGCCCEIPFAEAIGKALPDAQGSDDRHELSGCQIRLAH